MSGSTILAATQALAELQRTLRITSPVPLGINTVYSLPPSPNTALDYPCWINTWTFLNWNRQRTQVLQQLYTIHSDLWIFDPDQAAEIASAFFAEYVAALNHDITLSATVDTSDLRGADPTLVPVEWNGVMFAKLELSLDVTLSTGMTFG